MRLAGSHTNKSHHPTLTPVKSEKKPKSGAPNKQVVYRGETMTLDAMKCGGAVRLQQGSSSQQAAVLLWMPIPKDK